MSENKASHNWFENDVIAANIANLYLKPKSADVYFVFESENENAPERIPAHKVVLAATSNVFDTMFYGEMKMPDEIAISDATVSAFKEFLQFFYINKVELTEENVFEVADLGNRYNVTNCFEACFKFLKVSLTNEYICDGLHLALLYERADLLRFCRNRIVVHLIRDIRFASMTVKEFIVLYNSCGSVLTQDEYVDITQMITVGKKPTNPNINRTPRQLEWNSNAVISCTRSAATDVEFPNDMRPIERVRFYPRGKGVVLLGSFVCAKICDLRDVGSDRIIEMSFDIVITEAFASKRACPELENIVRCELEISLKSDSETLVSLPQPLLIQPHHLYDIAFVLKKCPGDDPKIGFYGSPQQPELHVDPDNVLCFTNESYDRTANYTPITKLEFNYV